MPTIDGGSSRVKIPVGSQTGKQMRLRGKGMPALRGGGVFAPVSREGGLLLNNLLLTTATTTVLLGTLYPLGLEVVSGTNVAL